MSQLTFQHSEYQGKKTLFAEVLLPLHLPGTFTYRIPYEWGEKALPGCRVVAPLGKTKLHTGIIKSIHENAPKEYEARYLLELLDEEPVILHVQFQLFDWLSDYYMCEQGDVLHVALPTGLKISSESKIQFNPAFDESQTPFKLTEHERQIMEVLSKNDNLGLEDLAAALNQKNIHGLLHRMVQKNAIFLYEEIKDKYQPKYQRMLRLTANYAPKKALEALFADLEKKPKMLEVLMAYLRHVNIFNNPKNNEKGLAKKVLQSEELSASSLNSLIKKGILEEYDLEVSRFEQELPTQSSDIKLSKAQQTAYQEILNHFEKAEICLLHGITGSGKTEIYIKLIQEVLQAGGQVLYLLPEIALTTQIVQRLKRIFGDEVGVYHSKYSDNERVEVWKNVLEGKTNFVTGVRSALFLPFNNLSLIIVDEEHEPSYKQYDPAPRYHARDSAVVLGKLHYAQVLLGSATPSFESFYNTKTGKYKLVQLNERYQNAQLPEIKLIDLKKEKKKKAMKEEYSFVLLEALQQNLNAGKQAILFQNRRGYAPFFSCNECGWIPQCENCAVSLTYHMYRDQLQCHYCGHRQKNISECKSCSSTDIKMVGFGTEKLEDDLKLFIPEANIQRMDLDTTRKKYSYKQIIEQFGSGQTDVLIGTQMVTKGLDFDNVQLVGILNADSLLFFPDFRAHERAYHLITQVSGRAGRRETAGTVWIQTYTPEHSIFRFVKENAFESFFEHELHERKEYGYPPFYRLINIVIKDRDKENCRKSAQLLHEQLIKILGIKRMTAVHEPMIAKIKNQYIFEILLKLEKGIDLPKVKAEILKITNQLRTDKGFRRVRVMFDVDPY